MLFSNFKMPTEYLYICFLEWRMRTNPAICDWIHATTARYGYSIMTLFLMQVIKQVEKQGVLGGRGKRLMSLLPGAL